MTWTPATRAVGRGFDSSYVIDSKASRSFGEQQGIVAAIAE